MDGEVECGSSTNGAGAETARLATSGPTAHVVRSIAVQLVDVCGAPRAGRVCAGRRETAGRWAGVAGWGACTNVT